MAETTESYGTQPGEDPGRFWHEQLQLADEEFQGWRKRGDEIVKRYRDERSGIEGVKTRFNILWSNIEVLKPALYGRMPKPEVSRRWSDSDPIGRLACEMLERTIGYEVEQFRDFDRAMSSVVEDMLLAGRGTAWVRYEPVIVPAGPEPMEAAQEPQISGVQEAPMETVVDEHSPVDYVYWKDFVHSPARTWDEVWWVGRWVYMTREEGTSRFGDVFNNVPIESTESSVEKMRGKKDAFGKKAKVCEIWDKRSGMVCWVAKGYPQSLDQRPDPLQLEGFFPCPKPLFATMTNGSTVPVPDFVQYQDQAKQLDNLAARATNLVKAIKSVGVYNSEFKELGRLFTEGVDNALIPVTQWGALAEKGGLKGAIDLMDVTGIIQALEQVYVASQNQKQIIYEICGISDILRGATDANETLGAQQLKANFGNLRLKSRQNEVARFAGDLFKLKAQIICKQYDPQLIVKMSNIQGAEDGRDPAKVAGALGLLKSSDARDFQIAVESDTLAQIDELAERQAAQEAIQAIAQFLQQAGPMVAAQPETLPMASEMLLFLVRRFRAGRSLESAIERAMSALQQKAAQAQGQQKPDPEQMKIQAAQASDQARAQADAQIATIKAQAEMQMHQQKIQFDAQLQQLKSQNEMVMENQRRQFEQWKALLDSRTSITVAEIGARAKDNQIPTPRPVETVTQ